MSYVIEPSRTQRAQRGEQAARTFAKTKVAGRDTEPSKSALRGIISAVMARDRERKCPPRLGSVRPSLAVNYTAHVADSQRFLLQGPAVLKNKRSRKIAKSGGLRFHSIASRARKRESCGRGRWRRRWVSDAGAFFPERGFVMPNRIDIDHTHSRAIVKEIGERLRAFLKEEPEVPASLRTQIDRLRESEEQSPSIIPSAERWDKLRR